ncbi:hypothetical protein D3C86_1888170 [compost metagenome]
MAEKTSVLSTTTLASSNASMRLTALSISACSTMLSITPRRYWKADTTRPFFWSSTSGLQASYSDEMVFS